jgi:hypothetical protein
MHFSIFNLKFSNTYKNQEKYDKKLDQILSYVVKTLFQKIDRLIAPYNFTAIFNQMTFNFLIAHNP